jgi:ketosteroid isomerase-like protein
MSEAGISVIKGMYECFGRGDIERVIAALTADIYWRVNGVQSEYPLFGVWNGTAEVKKFFAGVAEQEQFSEFSPMEFHASGDRVFVLGRYAGKIAKTGRPFASEFVHIFTLRGGKVCKFHEFNDSARFIDAWRG